MSGDIPPGVAFSDVFGWQPPHGCIDPYCAACSPRRIAGDREAEAQRQRSLDEYRKLMDMHRPMRQPNPWPPIPDTHTLPIVLAPAVPTHIEIAGKRYRLVPE